MRVRSIIAANMGEAMDRVRAELGRDAMIVSAIESEAGVLVSAAAGRAASEPAAPAPASLLAMPDSLHDRLEAALRHHGTPGRLRTRLLAAAESAATGSEGARLAQALGERCRFLPFAALAPGQALLITGPPGVGKTVTAARLAADAVLKGVAVLALAADLDRVGGYEQLASFMRLLQQPVERVGDAKAARDILARDGKGRFIVIDAPAINPFVAAERQRLKDLAAATGAEIVPVLAAGHDASEAQELAAAFAELGAERLIVTRLDATRRLGALLGAMADGLALAGASAGRQVRPGLRPLSAQTLARLLLRPTDAPPIGAADLDDGP
jgi:flagellar biosynthesis protein FlhF